MRIFSFLRFLSVIPSACIISTHARSHPSWIFLCVSTTERGNGCDIVWCTKQTLHFSWSSLHTKLTYYNITSVSVAPSTRNPSLDKPDHHRHSQKENYSLYFEILKLIIPHEHLKTQVAGLKRMDSITQVDGKVVHWSSSVVVLIILSRPLKTHKKAEEICLVKCRW